MQRSTFHKGEGLPLRVPAVSIAPVTSKCDGRERSSESGTGDQDAMVRRGAAGSLPSACLDEQLRLRADGGQAVDGALIVLAHEDPTGADRRQGVHAPSVLRVLDPPVSGECSEATADAVLLGRCR